MKTMTKEQAEKAAMEFAIDCVFKKGMTIFAVTYSDCITVTHSGRLGGSKSFPFADLVPGDVCLVWNDNQSEIIMLFSCADEDGSLLFSKRIANVIAGVGTYYTNYRKLDFNVLKIVKGWGDGD